MLIENLFNKLQINHHKKIVNYIKDFDIINIIDVGTHKGEFLQSCLNLEHVKKFYCFEPQISMISYLKKKLLNNKKIELFECALDSVVSKSGGKLKMRASETEVCASGRVRPRMRGRAPGGTALAGRLVGAGRAAGAGLW